MNSTLPKLGRGRSYIGGDWVESEDGRTIEVVDPSTGNVVGNVPLLTDAQVDASLDAAEAGYAIWSQTDVWSRAAILRRMADLLRARSEHVARTMTLEQGKPLAESRGEVSASADYFDWFADEARRQYGRTVQARAKDSRILIAHQPVGVVAAFTAWNFPALLPARKIAAALAAGCSIILKPAEEAPFTALELAGVARDAGLPPGVLNVVTGDPESISRRLIRSGRVRKVSLTGSIPVGKQILALCAEEVIPASMELGGHAPVLVLDDADVDKAAELCVRAKFRNAGQVCISPSRFFVARAVAEAFGARMADLASQLKVGPGTDATTDVGPLTNARRLAAVEAQIEDARAKGARVLTGGGKALEYPKGYFFEPTVIVEVDESMDVLTSEPFGPVAPVIVFDDVEEALARANALEYGLAGYVFTRDLAKAFTVSERLQVGMVGVNNLLLSTPEAPFGGVKQSGYGREGGSEGIGEYSVVKYINFGLS